MVQVVQNHSVCDTFYVTLSLDVLSWGEFISIFSHICGKLVFAYISIKGWVIHSDEDGFFDGSCQIMIFSAHNAEVVDGYIMTSGVMMVMDGWWGFHVFFVSLTNVLPDSLIYSSSQSTLSHFICISPLVFARLVSLSLGLTRRSLKVLSPLKCICMPCLLQMFLQLSLKPLMYGTTMWGLLVLLVGLFPMLLELLLDLLDLMLAQFKTQPGYLHLLNALLRWSSSSLNSWGLEQKVLALCVRVLMTVPLQVQICMCGLPIHSSDEGLARLWHHQCVQERMDPSSLDVS